MTSSIAASGENSLGHSRSKFEGFSPGGLGVPCLPCDFMQDNQTVTQYMLDRPNRTQNVSMRRVLIANPLDLGRVPPTHPPTGSCNGAACGKTDNYPCYHTPPVHCLTLTTPTYPHPLQLVSQVVLFLGEYLWLQRPLDSYILYYNISLT